MKASDFVAKFLQAKHVQHVYELSGGMITHLLDSIAQKTTIQIITMHHEQAAAFAADAEARVTGVPGVALATSGPGATNLLTGIGSCYFDSVPAVFITGQVNTFEQKGDRAIRQLGFQETDIVSMAKPITKAAFQISDPSDIITAFEQAFEIAVSGRPGPVLIDIPMNMQRVDIEDQLAALAFQKTIHTTASKMSATVDATIVAALLQDIQQAAKPVVLAGRGVAAAAAGTAFLQLVEQLKLPVITSLLALDIIPYEHPLRIGFIGSYGNRWANIAFGEADLVIVLGSRLDIRQTGADAQFFETKKIYHIDCEPGEINNRIKNCIPIVADVKTFIDTCLQHTKKFAFALKQDWMKHIQQNQITWPDTQEVTTKGINPNQFIKHLSEKAVGIQAYLADVGSHQMWAAQSLRLKKQQLFFTSAGMGAMGYALPAGIGTSIALGKKGVVVIIGDGCMQLNIQELQTIVRNALPVKIVVMNNRSLGMIRQFQDSYFESRYQSTYWGYSAPDFEKVALAYGIDAKTIHASEAQNAVLDWLFSEAMLTQPALVQVMIDPGTNTYPKIAFGRPITEMEPFAKPIAMEGT